MKVDKFEVLLGLCDPFIGFEILVEYFPIDVDTDDLKVKVWLRGVDDTIMMLISESIENIPQQQTWRLVKLINTKFSQTALLPHVLDYRKMKLLLTRKECFKCNI